ncbi:putative acetyltransferase NSI [Apostasia shenzhenica]|uniref:Putative acetyltransferase NSI n=1 Tax=Apostasia shenzhenica TaxID=1088818 RepID=A0A2I0A4U0_9ASPA|nr:putative acetyltransferase NSI [Apostasia shenzhenica]
MSLSSRPSIRSSSLLPFSPNRHRSRSNLPPISISTNPSHVDIFRLRDLFASAGHSCHRFPASNGEGRVEAADPAKLQTAIAHSFIVVSAFCHAGLFPSAAGGEDQCRGETTVAFGFEEFFERIVRAPGPDHRLVGFGRAVSDGGLTASIHDVVVMPSLQRRSIGRKIIEKIIRLLTNKGIYDISALCSEKERLFFEACGFGDDPMGSTTMMYTRTAPSVPKSNLMVIAAGQ